MHSNRKYGYNILVGYTKYNTLSFFSSDYCYKICVAFYFAGLNLFWSIQTILNWRICCLKCTQVTTVKANFKQVPENKMIYTVFHNSKCLSLCTIPIWSKFFFTWSVLDLLNFGQIHVCLDWCSLSITMQGFTPTQYKTAKIHRIGHTLRFNFSIQEICFFFVNELTQFQHQQNLTEIDW